MVTIAGSDMVMATSAEQRLSELGIVLPKPPRPLGAYVEAVRSGNLLFLSGMLPVVDGKPQFVGRLGANVSIEDGRNAAATAALNGLSAARAFLGSLDHVTAVAKLGVYMATEGDFHEHAKVADGASELLGSIFGTEKLSTRIVFGVTSLPLGAPLVLELVLEVRSRQ
jgi:enamine deaminase RidA (YjgF/YER057c/UK114 family)